MKKKIPLAILEALQSFADNNLDLIKSVIDSNSMFHLIDNDENSDFYFKVSKQESRSGKLHYFTEYQPKDKANVNGYSAWLTLDGVVTTIKKWLELLQAYNKIHTIYDDPIIKSNQERFEKQFDILDDNADTTSFNLHQQIYLDEYLNYVKSNLIKLQEGRNESQIYKLEQLASEATAIQSVLTKETKRNVKLLSDFQNCGLKHRK